MKGWAWLLPCWVWKYFFAQFHRERVLVDGHRRFLIRLDEEFALLYHPQGAAKLGGSENDLSARLTHELKTSTRTNGLLRQRRRICEIAAIMPGQGDAPVT